MATKIYLSPAAHEHDNACAYSKSCGENIHCNAYMDELETYLKACGFEIKRGKRSAVGSSELKRRVKEANSWGADLYYVCHTNAYDGTVKGSRPHVYPKGKGREWAQKLLDWRKKIYPYPCSVKTTTDLYEITATTMVVVYEEMVFHDNKEDAAFFHNNMRLLAEYTARGLCEIFGHKFVDPYERKSDGNAIYRVMVGSYTEKDDAEYMLQRLSSFGFSGVITAERVSKP